MFHSHNHQGVAVFRRHCHQHHGARYRYQQLDHSGRDYQAVRMYRSKPVLCTDLNLSYVQISKIATTVCIKTLFISTGVRRHNRSNLHGKNCAHWLISVALKISRLNTLMYYNIRTVVSLSIALRIWDIHFTLSLLYE